MSRYFLDFNPRDGISLAFHRFLRECGQFKHKYWGNDDDMLPGRHTIPIPSTHARFIGIVKHTTSEKTGLCQLPKVFSVSSRKKKNCKTIAHVFDMGILISMVWDLPTVNNCYVTQTGHESASLKNVTYHEQASFVHDPHGISIFILLSLFFLLEIVHNLNK